MIDGLPPLPLPLPNPALGKPAPAGDFAAWLGDPPRPPTPPPMAADAPPAPDPVAGMPLPDLAPRVPALPDANLPTAVLLAPPVPLPALPTEAAAPLSPGLPMLPPAPPLPVAAPIAAPIAAAAHAETAPPPLWQVAVHPADGVVELLSPWRLVAGASLSQVGVGRTAQALVHHLPLPRATPTAAGAAAAMGTAPTLPGAPFAVAGGRAPGPAPVAMPAPPRTGDPAPAADRVGAPPAQLASAAQWALRLLRWFEHRGDGATAWLRDYTATAANTAQLVADVREFARDEGLPLRRVVLNGRTVWAAPTLFTDTRGTPDAR
jgi:hypothetical protein